jgi:hypothetical protein
VTRERLGGDRRGRTRAIMLVDLLGLLADDGVGVELR